MTLARLLVRNLARRPARSALLVLFAGMTLYLLVFLRSIVVVLAHGVESSAPDRLMVRSAIGPFAELPASYLGPLKGTPGVRSVCRWSWFGGTYRDPSNFFPVVAVDVAPFLAQYAKDLSVPTEQARDLLADRRGCLAGEALARRHGWRVGDTVPIQGTLYPLEGGRAWELTVRAFYRPTDPAFAYDFLVFHWDHLEDTRRTLRLAQETQSLVTVYSVQVAPGIRAEDLAEAIDARWAAGPVRVQTQTERQHRVEELGLVGEMLGYLAWIGGAVVLATLLSVGNAMGIVASERRREAGILRGLGFPDHTVARLLVAESVALAGTGGILAAVASVATVPALRGLLGFEGYFVDGATLAATVGTGLLVGAVAGLWPAVRLGRVRPVEVLRDEA